MHTSRLGVFNDTVVRESKFARNFHLAILLLFRLSSLATAVAAVSIT
jgi:hypothetical protein